MANVKTTGGKGKNTPAAPVETPAPAAPVAAPAAPPAPAAPVAATPAPELYAGRRFTVDTYRITGKATETDAAGLRELMAKHGSALVAKIDGSEDWTLAADFFKPAKGKGKRGSNLPRGPRPYKPSANNAAFATLAELLAFVKPIKGHHVYTVKIGDKSVSVFAAGIYNALANACRFLGINAVTVGSAEPAVAEWAKQPEVESPGKAKNKGKSAPATAPATTPAA